MSSDHLDSECHLAAAGFADDTGTVVDKYDASNTGHETRFDVVKDGTETEVIGRLHTDIGNSHLFCRMALIWVSPINLHDDPFVLFGKTEDANAVIKITGCTLYTEICHINPAVLSAHARAFQDHNAIYPIQHVEVSTSQVATGVKSININNLINGNLPSILLIGMVDNSAMGGGQLSNPLCFKHLSLSRCST